MGSLINAASLGRAGIGIAYNDSVKRTFVRIMNYLRFLKRVEKNTYDYTGQVSATGGTVFWMSLGKQYWDKNTKRFNFL